MKKEYILPIVIIIFFAAFLFAITPKSPEKEKWMQDGWGANVNIITPKAFEPVVTTDADYSSNYKKSLELAKKTHKPVFVFFKADWCGWCKKMEVDTLAKPAVRRVLSQYVYCVLDSDKEKEIAKKYKVSSIPAYVVINAKGEVLKYGKGYKNESTFILWMNSRVGDSNKWGNVVWH
jgi:thiol:disulfide interchange protein